MPNPYLRVRKYGIFLEFGMPDGRPIPAPLLSALVKPLVYNHVEHLRGLDRLMADGSQRYVDITARRLYDLNENGCLQTSLGFLPRLLEICKQNGYDLQYEDLSPPKARPKAYEPDWSRLDRFTEWRYRQRECLGTIASSLCGIINAIPAFGKTEMIGRLAVLFPHAKFAVVTKRKDVAQTIFRRLTKVLSNVGFVGDSKKRYGRVTVYISKSMHKADPDVDFLFVDESHEACADETSEVLLRTFVHSRNFGFTATPDGRADGTSIRLEYMFGPQIFKLGWKEGVDNGLVVPVEVRWINIEMDRNPAAGYKNDVTIKKHGLWRNGVRNSLIAEAVQQHRDDQVLILVETVEHAVMLQQYLPDYALCYGTMEPDKLAEYISEGFLPEGYQPLSPAGREKMREDFEAGTLRHVIATDVWSTGVSFEQLAVLFRADGRDSVTMDDQAPGRVVRLHNESGKKVGIVYDCWDCFSTKFSRVSANKYRRYRKNGWTQFRPKVGVGG